MSEYEDMKAQKEAIEKAKEARTRERIAKIVQEVEITYHSDCHGCCELMKRAIVSTILEGAK